MVVVEAACKFVTKEEAKVVVVKGGKLSTTAGVVVALGADARISAMVGMKVGEVVADAVDDASAINGTVVGVDVVLKSRSSINACAEHRQKIGVKNISKVVTNNCVCTLNIFAESCV